MVRVMIIAERDLRVGMVFAVSYPILSFQTTERIEIMTIPRKFGRTFLSLKYTSDKRELTAVVQYHESLFMSWDMIHRPQSVIYEGYFIEPHYTYMFDPEINDSHWVGGFTFVSNDEDRLAPDWPQWYPTVEKAKEGVEMFLHRTGRRVHSRV